MHALEQLAGTVFRPLSLALLLALVAAVMALTGRRRASLWIAGAAALLTYLACLDVVGNGLISPLERTYPALVDYRSVPAGSCVVVLGSGYYPRAGIPITAALSREALPRVIEGVRLFRRVNASHLVLSGGAVAYSAPSAEGYAEMARELGLPAESLVTIDWPRSTAEEAAALRALIGSARVVLVTSAYHMPRAMRLMHRAGLRPIPAPTGHLSGYSHASALSVLLPTSGGLEKTERAAHEYLGLAATAAGIGDPQAIHAPLPARSIACGRSP